MCKEIVKNNNLENSVIFQDKISQEYLAKIYKRSSVFLLPTTYEIFGMVLLESMYFGIPTITTYNGGSSTLIEDEKDGFIIDELEENKWANKIIKIINSNNEEIEIRAKKKIELFTWDNLADKFIDVYNHAILEE